MTSGLYKPIVDFPMPLVVTCAGARSAGNPHATCDVAGAGIPFTVRLVRHSQRKRGATDRPNLRSSGASPRPYREAVLGASCVAAPVRDHTGNVVAAVSVSMLERRIGRQGETEIAAMVRSVAARIAAALGFLSQSISGAPHKSAAPLAPSAKKPSIVQNT